jgi:replicative DNA helicase
MQHVNDEAEQLLLSAIVNEPETIYDTDPIVGADDFYYESHRILYQAVRYLFLKNAYDIKALVHVLKAKNRLEDIGGIEYISQLRAKNGKRNTAKVYAEKVKEQSIFRSASRISALIQENIQAAIESGNSANFVNDVNALFNGFITVKENNMRHVSDVVKTAKEQSKEPKKSPLLGFSHIDNWMRGIGNERLIVVAGRPGTGKTAFSLAVCRNVATQGFGAVPVFSLEMSAEELVNRMLADMSGVPFQTIMTAEYQGFQESVVEEARGNLDQLPLYIDDSSRMDFDYIVAQCQKLKREHGSLGVLMIDYLGLVKVHLKKNQNVATAIGELTGDLKRLTRELGCSIILLVQMNRDIEKRGNKRPVMSDLRDSGSIEQDADTIIFLHKDLEKSTGERNHIDFIVEKGRQTGVSDFELWFYGAIQRFEVKE